MGDRSGSSPTLTILALFVVVFVVQAFVHAAGGETTHNALFTLSTPLDHNPWTLATSVYAHGSPSHLVANAIALAIVGFLLERDTTPGRFHLFFLATGALAGAAEVWVWAIVSQAVTGTAAEVAVLGGSGAIFALLGYLLTSNRLTDRLVGNFRLGPRVQLVVFAVVAVAITLVTAAEQVALVAHFTGLMLGLLGGRMHVLREPDGY